jgi:hypothetical protein
MTNHIRWETPDRDRPFDVPIAVAYVGELSVGLIDKKINGWACEYVLMGDGLEIKRKRAKNLPSEEVARMLVEQSAAVVINALQNDIPTP